MRSIRTSALCLALTAFVLGGCASVPAERESGASGVESVCIRKREINSMGALEDDRHVFVNVSANRYYLLSMDTGCLDLRFATGIAFADNATRVCGDGFSFLAFVHPEFGLTRCRVEWIDSVKDKKEAKELIEARESDARERQ